MRQISLAVSIFALAIASGTASAQAVGTYSGTSADGSDVTFTVSRSGNGPLMLTGAGISYVATCPNGIASVSSGIGFDPNVAIVSKKAKYRTGLPSYFYESFNLTFDTSNNTVSGKVTSVTPQLQKRSGTPTHSYVCTSATQPFTAALLTSSAKPAAAVNSVHYGQ